MIELMHSRLLNIAVGKSRKETKWKNTTIEYGALVAKLSKTHRTHETVKVYADMAKEEQDRLKDVGGFVGGHLKEGRRKAGHLLNRSFVTLDADFAPQGFWDEVRIFADHAMTVYSTHKHTASKPRLRVIIPLDRDVSGEEYEAISRKLAERLGIEYFDDTTYEPSRLMYWPSTSADGDYFFDYLDLPLLSADSVLQSYVDWRDTSFWPTSSRTVKALDKKVKKQGDPLAKTGAVGAFCRTYSVTAAIDKYLADVYVECATGGRYTYLGGSTSGGLAVYEDKWVYSNHSTDPTGGLLCNAFDLVRIHLYGDLDEDAQEDTLAQKLPSWEAMMRLVNNDSEVKAHIAAEHFENAKEVFAQEADNLEWVTKLTTTKGRYDSTIDNILIVLTHDKSLQGALGHNLFTGQNEVLKKLPWSHNGRVWADEDDSGLSHYLEMLYAIDNKRKMFDALKIAFTRNAYHPVKDYLDSLEWDCTPRVERLFVEYLGAEDSEYVRTVTRKALAAAVKRIYEPGCKFDHMITLIGDQGQGKSLLINRLGRGWSSDTLTSIHGKEAYEALDGVWLVEMAELTALKKSEREAIKNFISKQEDTYRKAYARNVSVNKRECIFIGTSNDREFLNDATGARRFWVINTESANRTKTVWEHLTKEEVDQIWAEARCYYDEGEDVMHLPFEVAETARGIQDAHQIESPWQGLIEDFMGASLPSNWYSLSPDLQYSWYVNYQNGQEDIDLNSLIPRWRICALEVWCALLGNSKANINNMTSRAINECIIKATKGRAVLKDFGVYGKQKGFELEGNFLGNFISKKAD